MRFSVDSSEPASSQPLIPSPSSSSTTPMTELKWVPLQNHPLFSSTSTSTSTGSATIPKNLIAWDGASRLHFWDPNHRCLHRISIRLAEPDPSSILAAIPSKVLQADVPLSFEVNRISINISGSALFLAGLEGLCVMYLYGRSSRDEHKIICRTVSIGSEIYFSKNNLLRTLQISWHPYSETHLGVLSSDSVFRIFDLSSAIDQPEQEYYLQPVEPGSSRSASSMCAVDFSFGSDHLWDRFSVFFLFGDGSLYILCPVVPFGSLYKSESILELYNDAYAFGLKSANPKAVKNSNLAISWLEATFPELAHHEGEGGNLFRIKAHPHVQLDASVLLQGPLHKVCHGGAVDPDIQEGIREGLAVSFIYNLISRDSILVTAWSSGQLQIDALADEIQPVWKAGSTPRLRIDSHDQLVGAAMICESVPADFSIIKLDQPPSDIVWLGHPPPLLRLAIVDLALPKRSGNLISLVADPLVKERIYCIHDGGIDSIVLHFLPFTSQAIGKEEPTRTPSVHAIFSTCPGESSPPSPLHGFLALSDSFGDSWILGLTCSLECVVLQTETWNLLLTHAVDKERESVVLEEPKETEASTVISKQLLGGPKAVLLPSSTPNLRSVSADSIEGRSVLHQYFKLFHENYVEYAHKVHFELQHHAPQLKKIIDNLHSRLHECKQKLLDAEMKQEKIEHRIDRAVQSHSSLEMRLQKLRSMPGSHKNPLSKAEQNFKLELDRFAGVELDALHSSIEGLNARLKKFLHSPQGNLSNQRRQRPGRRVNQVQDDEIAQLKSSLAKLSLINNENSKKVKLVESALKGKEISD